MIVPIKQGLRKFLNTTLLLETWLVVVSSWLRQKNSKGSGSGDLNFRNQGTLNDETFGCWKSPMWIIFFQYGFPHVYIWYFGRIKQPKESERIQDSLQEQEFYLTRLY